MLVVIGMMMARARDPDTWGFFTGEGPQNPDANAAHSGKDLKAEQRTAQARGTPQVVPGPTDVESEELDAAREEYQAIADRTRLSKEEMPSYWRMVRWAQAQTFDALVGRARKDVTFREIFEQPDKFRGKLVGLRLHVKQVVRFEASPHEAPFVKEVYEVWAFNDDSKPYSYALITTSLPEGIRVGSNVDQDITFAGYFLKLFPIEDHEGIRRAVPLLIGRVAWRPTPSQRPRPSETEWNWPWVAGGVLLLLYILRWGGRFFGSRPSHPVPSAPTETIDGVPIESWLEQVEDASTVADEHPATNGNGHAASAMEREMLDGREWPER